MSTAGIYNYHPKVEHPDKIFPQMKSTTEQPPFFFGGSQVPINLGIKTGSGVKTTYKTHKERQQDLDMNGRGISTTATMNHKIHIPKHFHR
jgi:hypothetical protein